jgi:hypothetical protein
MATPISQLAHLLQRKSTINAITMVYQVPGMPGQRSMEAELSIYRTNFGDFRNHFSIPGCLHRMQVIPACRA